LANDSSVRSGSAADQPSPGPSLIAQVFLRRLIELGFAAFRTKVNGLAFVIACGSGFLRINGHLADRVNDFHKSSCMNTQRGFYHLLQFFRAAGDNLMEGIKGTTPFLKERPCTRSWRGARSAGSVADAQREAAEELFLTQFRPRALALRANQNNAGDTFALYALYVPTCGQGIVDVRQPPVTKPAVPLAR
jgi:hypothetical protein